MKTMTMALFAGLLALGGAAYAQHDHGKVEKGHDHGSATAAKGDMVTLRGEVVDLACYMAHEGKGEKHIKCAKACLLGGAPAGILAADGTVTLLVEDHNAKKPYKAVLELAGMKAEVTGKTFTRGGLTAVVVSAVKKG
jgi:hypothetical protein